MIAQNRKLATINDSTLIVAVDIASQKHVARVINWRGHILGEPLIFDNRLEGFEVFLKWIRQLQAKHGLVDVVVGMEPTGHYWLNLAVYLRACDVPVVLVNPFHGIIETNWHTVVQTLINRSSKNLEQHEQEWKASERVKDFTWNFTHRAFHRLKLDRLKEIRRQVEST